MKLKVTVMNQCLKMSEVISVTQTKNADESELAERTEEMDWRFMKGSSEMTDAFGADRSPTVVIIDKDGMITFSRKWANV